MQEVYDFTRSLNESNGKQRISEYNYAGTFDEEGVFKLSGCMGRIYPAETIEKTNKPGAREEIADMSIKSQQVNMKTIHGLVSQDLGYIYGERENGPNGAKKQFLSKSAAFLRALGNDMGLKEFKVNTNPSGIACSGDVTLRGMWSDGNGLYFKIEQPLHPIDGFLYRTIKNMKDYSGEHNQWLTCSLFAAGQYEKLIDMMTELRNPSAETGAERHVA